MTEAAKKPSTPTRWTKETLRDPHHRADKARRVEAMFDAIAPTYERVNSVVSFGRDAAWRRVTVAAGDVRETDVVLDVACGTGDMLRTFAAAQPPPARLIGVDFSARMLALGEYDGVATPIHLLRADAQRLPLADESVDIISCAFGVRNFQNLQAGLDEMGRVARPGGRVLILEFSTPSNPLIGWAHRLYVQHVLPVLGTLISRDKTGAYKYLPRSVATFESRDTFLRRLNDAGFSNITARSMNLGGVILYRGEKRRSGGAL